MIDKQVGMSGVLATSAWLVALGIWVFAWMMDMPPLRNLSVMASVAAGTLTVRCFFISQEARIKTAIAVTATAREPGSVRTIR